MRPTYLQFRSPKEATPCPYSPGVTARGKKLSYHPASNKSTFGKSRRFADYDTNARRVGPLVGPLSYSTNQSSIGKARIKGGLAYRNLHNNKDVTDNGYFFVENHLVYDPSFVPRHGRARLSLPGESVSRKRPQSCQSARHRIDEDSVRVVDERKVESHYQTPKKGFSYII